MPSLVPVRVADCGCPDTPHDGHHVLVAPKISLDGAIEAEKAMLQAGRDFPNIGKVDPDNLENLTPEQVQAIGDRARALQYAWSPIFIRHGAKDWDLCDEQGNPIPFDVDEILADYELSLTVAGALNDLGYGQSVMAPFQRAQEKPSLSGPTTDTTSPPRTRTPSPRKRR